MGLSTFQMRGCGSKRARRVLVLGMHSPEWSLVVATVLRDCIERHGWAERLVIMVAGIGPGAGQASASSIRLLCDRGFDVARTSCPDLDQQTELLDHSDCVVVACPREADLILTRPEAEQAQVLTLCDFSRDQTSVLEDEESDLDVFLGAVCDVVPRLLGAIIGLRGEI